MASFLFVVALLAFSGTFAHPGGHQLKTRNLQHHRRRLNENVGLNSGNLAHNGIAVGFLPGFSEPVEPNTPEEINAKLPAPMAIMGDYLYWDVDGLNLSVVNEHLTHWKSLKGNPVWEMALMPSVGLEKVTQQVADQIAARMKWLNDQGIVVWLRFAHEMNGDWYKWGQKPALFIETWNLVARTVKSATKTTYMMWAPNSRFSNSLVSDARGGYSPYWPGKQYVDIVGLSFYHYGGYERLNILPKAGEALAIIKEFTDMYAAPNDLPFVLAETGASYTKSIQTGQPAEGGASNHDIKLQWLKQLLSEELIKSVPQYTAMAWFEISKIETAAGNSPQKSEDFRLLMGEETLSRDAVAYLSSSDS